MSPSTEAGDVPEPFRRALDGLHAARVRSDIALKETPAPQRLAPHTAALAAVVRSGETELAMGRLILLYDPEGQPGWEGTFRIVTYVRADLEPEIAGDPLLPPVGWSWLTEALDAHGATYLAPSGTVTRVASESFGNMADEPATSEVELRASWTPTGDDLKSHVEAWCDVLSLAAGLPPAPPGVAALPPRRRSDVG
ncbi:MAG: DUF3000 family protein [Streptosporangiales bacterium]|nr:DUF3000 family protein [Streptosporangiales bacterium]